MRSKYPPVMHAQARNSIRNRGSSSAIRTNLFCFWPLPEPLSSAVAKAVAESVEFGARLIEELINPGDQHSYPIQACTGIASALARFAPGFIRRITNEPCPSPNKA